MANTRNRADMIGRLTKDPELKSVGEGDTKNDVVNFSLVTNEWHKNPNHPDGGENVAEYHECEAWGSDARYLAKAGKKGSMVAFDAKIYTKLWEDKRYVEVTPSGEGGTSKPCMKPQTRLRVYYGTLIVMGASSGNMNSQDDNNENNTQAEAPAVIPF